MLVQSICLDAPNPLSSILPLNLSTPIFSDTNMVNKAYRTVPYLLLDECRTNTYDNDYTIHLLFSVLLEDFYANSVAPMVIQIVYVNGATVRTGVEIEGSLVVRMLQYGDVVESFQRLKTKEGTSLTIWALSTLHSCLVLFTTRMSTS